MKSILFVLASLFCLCSHATLKTVDDINLKKYQGTWHQLAAVPASFQRDCASDTRADYSLLEDGLIKVINSCKKNNGKIKSSEARGRINPDFNSPGKLEVTFVKLIKWIWAFSGDYWITYLDPNYQYVVVGHPEYKYGWILARNQTLSKKTYSQLEKIIGARGYDSCAFLMSTTSKQHFKQSTPLCEYVK